MKGSIITDLERTTASDALHALSASLSSEREWRNIQKTIVIAVGRVVAVLTEQNSHMEAFSERLDGLEARVLQAERDADAKTERSRSEIASQLTQAMRAGHEQLTERVCAHVDARLAAQSRQMDERWEASRAAWRREDDKARHEDSQRLRQQVVDEARDAVLKKKTREPPLVDTVKLDTMERQLKRLDKHVRSMESEIARRWSDWRHETSSAVEAKPSHSEVAAAIESKLVTNMAIHSDAKDCVERLESQVLALHEELQAMQQRTDENAQHVEQQLARQATGGAATETTQLKNNIHELLGIVENLQSEQSLLKTLVLDHGKTAAQQSDTKQAVVRLHDAVKSVRRSVETVAKRAEMEALHEQVTLIRKQLRSEIYQARYIWKEGRPTATQTVPWTTQVVNSNADVFVWQRSTADAVTAMVPGLYHLQAAFFTSFSPTLQVFVNGEPALILTSVETHEPRDGAGRENAAPLANQASAVGARRRRLHHSAGELVGVEITAFLALPARACVAIGYDIDEKAQGFLNLRKL